MRGDRDRAPVNRPSSSRPPPADGSQQADTRTRETRAGQTYVALKKRARGADGSAVPTWPRRTPERR